MKVVDRELEKRLHRRVSFDEMQLDVMPVRGAIDAVCILRRIEEEYHAKGRILYVFCGP